MPYINEDERLELNSAIEVLSNVILNSKTNLNNPRDFSRYLGRINYCFSRIIMNVMGDVSYSKIAMATGVLENIKQELYRRVAGDYEDKKIAENGDIKEYKNLNF
jgi:hypothetical protein